VFRPAHGRPWSATQCECCASQGTRKDTSDAINKVVRANLQSFAKAFRRKVVLDLEAFERLGPYVNWRALMNDA
jgi:hypothetical protein